MSIKIMRRGMNSPGHFFLSKVEDSKFSKARDYINFSFKQLLRDSNRVTAICGEGTSPPNSGPRCKTFTWLIAVNSLRIYAYR
jgi:hypothetical protein